MTYDLKSVFYLDTSATITAATAGAGSAQLDLSAYIDPIARGRTKGTGLAIYKAHFVTSQGAAAEPIDDAEAGSFRAGLVAGLGFAILTLLNRLHVREQSPLLLTCWQNGFAALILIPWSLYESWEINTVDWFLLFLLGVVCTVGGHSFLINGLRYIPAQLASLLIAGLEPVVAIFFALLFLGEVPSFRTVVGGVFILIATLIITKKAVV